MNYGKPDAESPIGQSLQGHKEGDQVRYKSETGKIIDIKVLKIN
ncbi:GreA/GreB family elongation factor [Candidatus Phytoplasma australasiaticum]